MLKRSFLTAATFSAALAFVGCTSDSGGVTDPVSLPSTPNIVNFAPVPVTSTDLYSATVANGTELVVGNVGLILRSTDGTNFSPVTSGTSSQLDGVGYGNGTFVAVGQAGTIITSSDLGLSWQTATTPQHSQDYYGVTYGNGVFVAVGLGSVIATSTNGINWTGQTAATTGDLWSVSFGNGRFVAVDANGGIETSVDGATWTADVSPTTNPLYSVTRGVSQAGGEFVAVGGSGTALTSPDGINWTKQNTGADNTDFYGVTIGPDNLVVATGGVRTSTPFVYSGGALSVSHDAMSWAGQSISSSNYLYAATNGFGQFILVGVKGAFFTASSN